MDNASKGCRLRAAKAKGGPGMCGREGDAGSLDVLVGLVARSTEYDTAATGTFGCCRCC